MPTPAWAATTIAALVISVTTPSAADTSATAGTLAQLWQDEPDMRRAHRPSAWRGLADTPAASALDLAQLTPVALPVHPRERALLAAMRTVPLAPQQEVPAATRRVPMEFAAQGRLRLRLQPGRAAVMRTVRPAPDQAAVRLDVPPQRDQAAARSEVPQEADPVAAMHTVHLAPDRAAARHGLPPEPDPAAAWLEVPPEPDLVAALPVVRPADVAAVVALDLAAAHAVVVAAEDVKGDRPIPGPMPLDP